MYPQQQLSKEEKVPLIEEYTIVKGRKISTNSICNFGLFTTRKRLTTTSANRLEQPNIYFQHMR
jgi:hypothetical protein